MVTASSLWKRLASLPFFLLLNSCSSRSVWLFHPKGAVAAAELHYTLVDFGIMMCIIAPVLIASGFFAFRYRKGGSGRYDPTFRKSKLIEVLMWGVPLATVGLLTYFSYHGVFRANPYNPTAIARSLSSARAAPATLGSPSHFVAYPARRRGPELQVNVITTDWQWVFIYPKEGIATVDELVVPVHTPVHFRLTSTTVVNDFLIPELVGEIDIMPGMRTKQAMIADTTGTFHGYSANYSGGGFSWMGFAVHVVSPGAFKAWVSHTKAGPARLTDRGFNRLAEPTINLAEKPQQYGHVQAGLFSHVIQSVMLGRVYTTPLRMTENMTKPLPIRIIQ